MKKNKNRIILICMAVLLILVLAVFGFYSAKLNLIQHSDGTISGNVTIDEEDEELKKDASVMESVTEGLEESDAVYAEGEIVSSKDVINVLLIGTDERTNGFSDNARGDSCILMSLNKKTMKMKLISFERGMGVPILEGNYKGQWDWLTHTFRYGGADLMMKEIRECFKIDVSHYVRVNFSTFEQAINAVGGVEITLSKEEANAINNVPEMKKTGRTVSVGKNKVDGVTALQYARLRSIDNDWHRIKRQRAVIESTIKGTQSLNVVELNNLFDKVLPLVQTNFTQGEITALLPLALKYNQITVEQMTMPAENTFGSMTGMGGRKMFAVDFEKNSEILEEFLYK